jgi:hypothetical protein
MILKTQGSDNNTLLPPNLRSFALWYPKINQHFKYEGEGYRLDSRL